MYNKHTHAVYVSYIIIYYIAFVAGTGLLFYSRVSRRMTREQSVTNNNNEKPIMLIPTLV